MSTNELQVRMETQTDLWKWMKRRESYWAQHSRARWIKECDRNTKYFHTLASIRRRKNQIERIVIDGECIKKPAEIKKEAAAFFQNIFHEEYVVRPTFNNPGFKKLSAVDSSYLTAPFSRKEIDDAVDSCSSQKAPGPDGYNFLFIKSSWEIIKQDFTT